MRRQKSKIAIFLLTVFLMLPVCVGCETLPTYNLSKEGSPDDTLSAFLDSFGENNANDSDIGELVYNYSWEPDSTARSENVSDTDLRILACIEQSRSYEITGARRQDSHHAVVSVKYTVFDMRRFRKELTDSVVKEIKQRQYDGEVFDTPADTAEILQTRKSAMLQTPEQFYTTQDFEVEMISSGGRWRVVLSEPFYRALTGYTV